MITSASDIVDRLPPDASMPDRREDLRHRTVLQIAKLETLQGDQLCILRNVSAGGLEAVVYCDLAVGDPVQFELRTGRCMAGLVVWTKGSSIGVAFDQKVPILSYLTHQAIQEMGRRVRSPRVRMNEPGRLRIAGGEFAIDIQDASQAGMRIRTNRVLAVGEPCHIAAGGFSERSAFVRWSRDGEVGIQLNRPLSFSEFGQWRAPRLRGNSLN
jgi:hypothetical protein